MHEFDSLWLFPGAFLKPHTGWGQRYASNIRHTCVIQPLPEHTISDVVQ